MTKHLNIADQLGIVRARISELQADEKALKAEIVAIGHAVDGELFRAVPITAERTTVSWKQVAAKLNPSRQLITAYSKVATVVSVKVTARLASVA